MRKKSLRFARAAAFSPSVVLLVRD